MNRSLRAKGALVHRGHFIRCQECVCCMFMRMLLRTCSPSTLPTSHEAAHSVSWQTLLLSQQLQKLKYSSLMRCLQQLIYFDSLRPAVKNIHIHGWIYVMEKEHLYKSICYTQTHCLLFFSVILAASATKWSDCQGFRTITILQSPLCPFLLGRLGLCPGLIHHKG